MNVHPFEDVAKNAQAVVEQGGTIHQQFNCGKCGAKQTMEEPNKFFVEGKCEECGHVTDLVKAGCNFLTIWSRHG